MKVEQAQQIASNAIEQLRQALEAGQSGALKEYLAAMARFRRYSWHNVMLIASQKPSATHVAGFQAWHRLGRLVKKGEKGILILAPVVRKKAENGAENEQDQSSTVVAFRAAYVFDVSQTDGQPLPEIGSVNGDPREHRERLAKFVADKGITLGYSEEIAPARGVSEGGKITLLPGQSPAEEFATLAHEVAHEMLHRDELRSATTKRIRETEAEAVAFVVCSAIGLETGTAAQDYIGLYGGDAKLLSESLEYVQRTATQILNAIGADDSSAPPAYVARADQPLLDRIRLMTIPMQVCTLGSGFNMCDHRTLGQSRSLRDTSPSALPASGRIVRAKSHVRRSITAPS